MASKWADKSRYKIYWGLRDEDEIPKMAACGKGDGGADASSGNKKPEKPKQLGEPSLFDKLKDWIDDNKDLLKTLALGAVAAALLAGTVVAMRRNRKNTDEKLKDLEDAMKDAEGFDLDLLRQQKEALLNEPYDSGVDADVPLTELKIPPDYIGQQAIVDGDLYVYKDPPGAWVNFGPVTPRYNPSQGIAKPVTREDFRRITLSLNIINNSKKILLWLNNKSISKTYLKIKKKGKKIPVNNLNNKKVTIYKIN